MPSFNRLRVESNNRKTTRSGRFQKVDPTEIFPQSLTTQQMAGSLLEDVESYGVVNLPNGSVLTITTTTSNRIKPDELRLGVQPFQIALYEDNYLETYRMPISANVAFADYDIIGPLSEPDVRVTNTSGTVLIDIGHPSKVITKTYIKNNSGAAHNIIYFTGARTFSTQMASAGTPSNT